MALALTTAPAWAQVQPPEHAKVPAAAVGPAENAKLPAAEAGAPEHAQLPAAEAANPAVADSKAEAEKKVGEAEQGYEAGDYRTSLEKLTEARALYASPALHFNFGLSYRGLARDREALEAFQRFVRETSGEDPTLVARRREAAWHIEALQGRLQRAAALTAPPALRAPPLAVSATAPPPTALPVRLYRRWWFWAAVGAVAAGAAGTALLWRRSSPGPCAGAACSLGEFGLP